MLSIKNPVDSKTFDSRFITTKKGFENHGYGLKSVYKLVKQVDGIIEKKVTDNYVEFDVPLWNK